MSRRQGVARLVYRKQEWEVRPGMTVRDAILKAGLKPYDVLPVRDGKLINEETIVRDGDEIKLVAVVSGG
jgi:sulfur carrier protein ThiS